MRKINHEDFGIGEVIETTDAGISVLFAHGVEFVELDEVAGVSDWSAVHARATERAYKKANKKKDAAAAAKKKKNESVEDEIEVLDEAKQKTKEEIKSQLEKAKRFLGTLGGGNAQTMKLYAVKKKIQKLEDELAAVSESLDEAKSRKVGSKDYAGLPDSEIKKDMKRLMKQYEASKMITVRKSIKNALRKLEALLPAGYSLDESVEELDEIFKPEQISALKKAYSTVSKIDPSGPAYKKMKSLIQTLSKDDLEKVARAKIRFVSGAAATELRVKHGVNLKANDFMESVELDEEKTKWKMGDGRPRNGARIENDRFWNLPYDTLKYIAKDAGEAMRLNPTARKATAGPGNWADQVADAATVMHWRKKNGIMESVELDEAYETVAEVEKQVFEPYNQYMTNIRSALKTMWEAKQDKHTAGATAPEEIDSKASPKSKEFAAKHNAGDAEVVLDVEDAHETSKSVAANNKKATPRTGDKYNNR